MAMLAPRIWVLEFLLSGQYQSPLLPDARFGKRRAAGETAAEGSAKTCAGVVPVGGEAAACVTQHRVVACVRVSQRKPAGKHHDRRRGAIENPADSVKTPEAMPPATCVHLAPGVPRR